MNFYFSYILLLIPLAFSARYLYIRWMKNRVIAKIQVQGYAGLPPLIWCYNSMGDIIKVIKCEGWQILKLGRMIITIKNSQITEIK